MSWRWLFWWRPPCLLRQVTVHLYPEEPGTTQGIEGLLWQSRGPWLVLREATWIQGVAGIEPTKRFMGEVVIPRVNVLVVQVMR